MKWIYTNKPSIPATTDFMQQGIRCCVCDNRDPERFTLKYRKEHYAVVSCNVCSFCLVPPHYRQHTGYTAYKNGEVAAAVRAGNNWLKVQRHKLRFRFIRKFVERGSLFDLGAGWGHFMLAGRELGYDVHGIEICDEEYRYCKNDLGLPVEHVDFFDMEIVRRYDTVTLWDVLEHIDRADEFLAKCAAITEPGGHLFLQVPQIDSHFAKRRGEKWNMLGLDHVNYFSPQTITRLLKRHGYEVLEIKSSLEIKLFLMYTVLPLVKKLKRKKKTGPAPNGAVESQQYFNRVTRRPHWQLVLLVALHNCVYRLLSFLGIGEEMMVAARKKTTPRKP